MHEGMKTRGGCNGRQSCKVVWGVGIGVCVCVCTTEPPRLRLSVGVAVSFAFKKLLL